MAESLRERVRRRAKQHCEYCQMPEELDMLVFHLDHIYAQKHHGPTEMANLAWSCFACNNQKQSDIAGIDPDGNPRQIVRLFHPRTDHWNDHFTWDGPELVAKTPVGRVTLYVLGINLPHRVALRQLLMDEGVFPFFEA
jgi:HNH endonuclease